MMLGFTWLYLLCCVWSVLAKDGEGGDGSQGGSLDAEEKGSPASSHIPAFSTTASPSPPAIPNNPSPDVPTLIVSTPVADPPVAAVTADTPAITTPPPPNSSPSSPTSTFPTLSSPIPSGSFQFTQPGNLTTCQPANFSWHFSLNIPVPVTIMVTNERATRPLKLARRGDGDDDSDDNLVSKVLSTTVTATAGGIQWAQVDIDAGPYSVVAYDTAGTGNLFGQSRTFFVNNGIDTACIEADEAGAAPSTVPSTTSPTQSTATPSSFPVVANASKSLSTGALVGTVAGVVVGVVGVVAAFTVPRIWRHGLTPMRRPGGPYHLF